MMGRAYRPRAAALAYLRYVADHPGVTAGAAHRALRRASRAAAYQAFERLAAAGLVSCRASGHLVRLYVTPAGEAVLTERGEGGGP